LGLLAWLDLILFFLLFALFVYVFISVTITNLHKVYLIFHFSMMLWPFCQFAIHTTENPKFQLFYVKLAFVDTSLLAVGWLLFTIFLTGQSLFLQKKISFALFVPALLGALGVIINPNGMFVHPLHGDYIQRNYGSLFWFIITILIGYIIVSLLIMYRALVSDNAPRIKKQVKHVLNGILVMTAFILLDIFLNVVLAPFLPVIPGLTSFGILLSAIFFVIAIHRDKVFDIVTIAHQDIIDTIAHGILVLNDSETVVEINQSLLPQIDMHIGDRFDMATILPQGQSGSKIDLFLQAYRKHPLERIEIEIITNEVDRRHISIHAAPIMVSGTMVGRIITFQDMSELRRLIDETNLQNEILQDRNQSLIVIQDELFQTNQKLEQMAITDSLTGCYNRHYLTQQLEHEVMKNMRYQIPFAIFLLDIDFFKLVNDNYGHLVGDEVICSTVEAIKQTLRRTDILARYGGEEFIIYLPHTSQSQANILAERVKSAVESNKVIVENIASSLSITISMGLLSINHFTIENLKNPKTYLNELFESVDKALYQAKKEGRNRIVSILR
jgi:two-component system cell cycle response regulator